MTITTAASFLRGPKSIPKIVTDRLNRNRADRVRGYVARGLIKDSHGRTLVLLDLLEVEHRLKGRQVDSETF